MLRINYNSEAVGLFPRVCDMRLVVVLALVPRLLVSICLLQVGILPLRLSQLDSVQLVSGGQARTVKRGIKWRILYLHRKLLAEDGTGTRLDKVAGLLITRLRCIRKLRGINIDIPLDTCGGRPILTPPHSPHCPPMLVQLGGKKTHTLV